MTIILATYLLGLLACLLVAATHPGARPYTRGSYARQGLVKDHAHDHLTARRLGCPQIDLEGA